MKTLTKGMLATTLALGMAFVVETAAVAGGTQDGHGAQSAQMSDQQGQMSMDHMHGMKMQGEIPGGKVDAEGKATGPTMGIVFTADSLYWCPMHHEVVTDNPDAHCPLCNMKVVKLSEKDVAALRASSPQGCIMHPIVKPAADSPEKCDICGMKLMPIQKPETQK